MLSALNGQADCVPPSFTHLLADSLPHLVWVTGADGNMEYLNRRCLEYFGLPMADLLGWDWGRVVHPDDLPRAIELWTHCLRTGSELAIEYRLLRHDGVFRWHLGRAQAFRDPARAIRRWFGTCTDIDDQKRAEQSLAAMNVALENAVEGIGRLDAEGRYVSVNPAYARILGFEPDEMVGMACEPTVYTDDRQALRAAHQRMRETGREEVELRGVRKDGGLFYKRVVMVRAEGAEGQFVGNYCFMRDITEKRMAEEALRASETRFRVLIENSYDAVQLLANDGTILYATPAIVRTGGRTPAEVVGHQAFEWSHPDDLANLSERFIEFLDQPGTSQRVESRYLHKDGSWRWAEATCTNLLHEPGVRAVVVNVHDITDRKQAEEALRESNDLLRAITEGTTDAIFVKDREGRFLQLNAACADVFAKPPGELIGREEAALLPTEVATRIQADDLAVMAAGTARTYEETIPTSLGTRVFLTSKAPYRDATGAVAGVIGISRDITDRKCVEEDREKFVALVENAIDFIAMATLDGHVFYVNSAGRRLLGMESVTAAQATRIEDYVPADVAAIWREVAIPQALAGGRWEGEVRFRHFQTGQLLDIQQCLFVVQTPESGQPLCLATIARDVTERKRLEVQLRQAQKMEAVGRLAAGVAHDFNNLLTVINGYSEIILASLDEHSQYRAMIEDVFKAGERAVSLTRQLLAFSRQQMLQPKVLDLNVVVAELCNMLRRVIGEDLELILKPGPGLLQVAADPGQIEQVLMNLAVNARDAMPTGGKLTVETRNEWLEDGIARDGSQIRPGPYVLLSVSDTGSGMTADVRAHIFEPFFTTKEPGSGSGLGLATVYGVVQQSGGHIDVETTVGEGTTFRVYLPAIRAEASAAKSATGKQSLARGTETVLVVEDEAAVRGLAKLMLQQLGYTVLAAASAEEALTLCQQSERVVDLMLSDVVMPGMSGRALAEKLQADNPNMRVLYMSGYTDDAVVRHGVKQERVSFIQKPFTAVALARKVREVLNQPASLLDARSSSL